jgi:quercetin dioxygenase-like cupin family protein
MAIANRHGMTWMWAALACIPTGTVMAQDMVNVSPKNTKVLLDNAEVRVIEVELNPHEIIPMHSHPASIVYYVTPTRTKTTTADGKVTEIEHKGGDAVWHAPVTHSNENVGTTPTEVIVTELKTSK